MSWTACASPEAIFATNTSFFCLSPRWATGPEAAAVIGMHFFNPVPRHEAGGDHPRRQHHPQRDLRFLANKLSQEIGKEPVRSGLKVPAFRGQ